MNDLCAVILAAGQGTRMRSKLPKVVHPVAGLPMIAYVVEACRSLQAKRILVITGHQADRVREALGAEAVEFVSQPHQGGTAHALLQAQETLTGFDGDLLVVAGDTPLLTSQTLNSLLRSHRETHALATVLTAELADPTGYGRVIRSATGELLRIVEEPEATPQERQVHEITPGSTALPRKRFSRRSGRSVLLPSRANCISRTPSRCCGIVTGACRRTERSTQTRYEESTLAPNWLMSTACSGENCSAATR